MIIGNLVDVQHEIKMNERFQIALSFLIDGTYKNTKQERIHLMGEKVYARILKYQTIPFEDAKFEAHRKYIDIHYVVDDAETIWTIHTSKLHATSEYDPEKDVWFGLPDDLIGISKITLSKDQLAVFFPTDAHAPKGLVVSSKMIDKIVLKIAVD